MTDLERLFRRLVDNLIAIDPARLHRSMPLSDLYESVIPYRTNRRSLSIDTAEDYDFLLLRLCAGEGGFLRMLSPDVAERFRSESTSTNPNLDLIRAYADAELQLETEPLAHALGPGPEEAFAPPEDVDFDAPPQISAREADDGSEVISLETLRAARMAPEPVPIVPAPPRMTAEPDPDPPPRSESGIRCSFCGGRLPTGRPVNFCPHCGQNQSFVRCPECQAEIELGWRHCINCGQLVGEE
jgi:double zinc ribbon protein